MQGRHDGICGASTSPVPIFQLHCFGVTRPIALFSASVPLFDSLLENSGAGEVSRPRQDELGESARKETQGDRLMEQL
jgi:hypothetical protein